jgi:phosphatidate cytidylyltransferase
MTDVDEQAPARDDGALSKRIASSAILIPAALAALYAGGAVFAATVAFGALVMAFEWSRMIEGRALARSFYALALSGAAALYLAGAEQFGLAYLACAVGAFTAWFVSRTAPVWAGFGAVYIFAPAIALIWLRNGAEGGRSLALMLLIIVWAADTGGYIAGRLVGGPRMNPSLSPAKTWAGAAGGLIMGAIAGLFAARFIFGAGGVLSYVLAGAALGVASILGDMAESAFKRVFGVKDTSGFIPGHGGALDRLDGLIFATTAMALVVYLLSEAGRLG